MFNNFDSWRSATMACNKPAGLAHYHYCSDVSYRVVRDFLAAILKQRTDRRLSIARVKITDNLADAIIHFLSEMEFAYLHPRRTSAKFMFSREKTTAIPTT